MLYDTVVLYASATVALGGIIYSYTVYINMIGAGGIIEMRLWVFLIIPHEEVKAKVKAGIFR